MWLYAFKVVLSTAVIVAVAELAKRNPFWAAGLVSLPLTSLLTFVWVYLDTGDTGRIATLSCIITAIAYLGMVKTLGLLGIRF